MSNYPEHKKLEQVQKESQFLGEFLEWLQEQNLFIARYEKSTAIPVYKSINTWLGEFLDIDLVKLEKEKVQMLDEIRGSTTHLTNN